MVEQRSPKPRAEGSSPSAPAKKSIAYAMLFILEKLNLNPRDAERVVGRVTERSRCEMQRSKSGCRGRNGASESERRRFGHRKRKPDF